MANQGCKCKCLLCGAETTAGKDTKGGYPCTTPDCTGYFTEYNSEMRSIVYNLYNLGYRVIIAKSEAGYGLFISFAVLYPSIAFPRLLDEMGFVLVRTFGNGCAVSFELHKNTQPSMNGLTRKERISALYHWTVWLKDNNTAGFEVLMANLEQV